MKEQVLNRVENFGDVRGPEITTIETFEVESTGARISTLCSVSLLHQYCARLAHDRYSSQSLPKCRKFGPQSYKDHVKEV